MDTQTVAEAAPVPALPVPTHKYYDRWRPSIPLMPAFRVNMEVNHTQVAGYTIHTVFSHPLHNSERRGVVRVGLNLYNIPHFCGGAVIACINFRSWPEVIANEDRIQIGYHGLYKLARVEDFLGDDWRQQVAGQGWSALPEREWPVDGAYLQAAAQLAMASVWARTLCTTQLVNKNIINAWDRRTGATAAYLAWCHKNLFRGGIRYDNHYAQQDCERSGGRLWDRYTPPEYRAPISAIRMPYRDVYPDKYRVSKGRINHNSSALCSAYTYYTRKSPPMRVIPKDHVTIRCSATDEWAPMFVGPELFRDIGIPESFYPG